MGFLSKLVKKAARVLDNPLTRAIAPVLPGGTQAALAAATVAGNQAAVAGLMGGSLAATTDAQSNIWTVGPSVMPGATFLQAPNLTTLPGVSSPTPSTGGGGATGSWAGGTKTIRAPVDTITAQFPGAPVYRVLSTGKVRIGRLGADGKAHFHRRMNPMNPRAARRAIKRIKHVRQITRAIESTLPRARAHR